MKIWFKIAPIMAVASATWTLLAVSEPKTNITHFAVAAEKNTGSRADAAEYTRQARWMERNLEEIEKIKVGSSRKAVEEIFTTDGGLQPLNPLVMCYRKCPWIKVDIDFATSKDDQGRVKWGGDDKVVSVSKPYLQRPTIE